MNFIKKNLPKLVLITFFTVLPVISFAQEGKLPSEPGGTFPSNPSAGKLVNPLGPDGIDSIPGFIEVLLEGVLKIGIPIVALAVIFSGFLFVFARGNSEKLTKAKDALLYTLIGAAILLGSWAIAEMIRATVTGVGS